MKYVTFDKVTIKNFLSVGETPVCIDFNTGLNIITGNNKDKVDRRNGVGKSTVADSVYFAIFGSTLRELKKDHIVNNITQRNCEVQLEFKVQQDNDTKRYKIVRKIAPTKCYLFQDGEDITRDSIVNTTEYICDLLNTTPDVFQNCVIMTVNNVTPFMAKKKLEKRKFIEGIFNLQVFSNMLTTARQEYNKVVRDLDVECAKYEEISNTISAHTEQKQNMENEKIRALDKLKARKKHNHEKIDKLEQHLQNHEQMDVEQARDSVSNVDQVIAQVEQKIHNIVEKRSENVAMLKMNEQKIAKAGTTEETCPVCFSKLDDGHRHHIDQRKTELSQSVSALKDKVSSLDSKLDEAKTLKQALSTKRENTLTKINNYQLKLQEFENVKQQIKQLNTLNKDIDDDLDALKNKDVSMDKMIAETEKRLENTQQVIDVIKKDMAKLEIIKFIVSEEGVKSYIVKKILQLFNAKLAHYLKKMDSNCICVFNEYFEEEIVNEKGKPCSYFNFSGAERKNIDLACLFAFMDIRRMQGDVAFNFSIYDELFDSSLDERGVELVIDILKERIDKYNECVMVISHRKESAKLASGEIIFLEKQNGVTIRIEPPESELK